MHEVFGHSLKVKIFYVPFHFVDLDFGDYVIMKIISEVTFKKDKKCS